MIQGTGTTSLRKQDVTSQKTPAIGFKKIVFAHKATSGDTGINLSSLSLPPEMPGFTNPNTQELQAANLLFYRKNLTLISSLRGVLIDYMSYDVASNTSILFSDDFGTALEGEIFVGTIDHSVSSGNMVVDAEQIGASGILTANTADFNVGTPFTVNAYSNRQFGEVMVFLDGALQYRNTNNSSTTLDGNYYEVDTGDGTGIIIRFNVVDPVNDRDVIVAGIGVVAERPSGSMMAVIESIAGKIDSMASVVSDLSGLTEFQIVGANPSSVDLKAFGDRVIGLEQPGSPGLPKISTATVRGANYKYRTQTKVLAANVVGNGTDQTVASLGFNNLTVGKFYRISGYVYLRTNVTNSQNELKLFSGTSAGTRIGSAQINPEWTASITNIDIGAGINFIFQAASSTVTVLYAGANAAGVQLVGNNTKARTFLTLEELDSEETSDWT